MKLINILKENAFKLMFLILFSTAESYYFINTVFEITNVFFLSFLASLAIIALGIIIVSLPRIVSLSLSCLIAVALVYLLIYFNEPVKTFLYLINTAIPNSEFIKLDKIAVVLFVVSFVFILVNFIIIMPMNKSFLSMALSLVFIAWLYFKYDYINILFAIFYLASVMLVFLMWAIPKSSDDNETGPKKFLVPFVLLLSVAVILSPLIVIRSNNHITPLAWIDDIELFKREKTVPTVIVMIDSQSQLTNLNDEFSYNTSRMMNVISPYVEKLRSKTYDSYTIDGWVKTQEDTDPNPQTQYTTLAEFTQLLNENNIEYIPYKMTIELIAHSQMIFAPLHSELITELENEININPYDDIYADAPLDAGTRYSLNTVRINYMSDGFINLLTNSQSDNIANRENYLAIPEYLEDSLKPIAEKLTKDVDSNYEKAKIIESYLSQKYTYNLTPPEKPANADFVEYFLFETGEGFCTHYASSMVLMLRSIDIPCRYVTGYVLNAPDDYEVIPDLKAGESLFVEGLPYEFTVQKQNSHAWVEVWFDDFGWLAFEPTSRYTSAFGFPVDMDFSEFIDVEEPEQIQQIEMEAPDQSSKIVLIILSSVLLLALIVILSARLYTSTHRTDKEKIYITWKNIKKLYQKSRKAKKVNETAMEFVQRVNKDNIALLAAARIYEIAAFSDKEITATQISEINKLYKSIRKINEKQK